MNQETKTKPTHVVVHKRLYMRVNGKMQHMAEGKQLTLTAEAAKKLGARVQAIGK